MFNGRMKEAESTQGQMKFKGKKPRFMNRFRVSHFFYVGQKSSSGLMKGLGFVQGDVIKEDKIDSDVC